MRAAIYKGSEQLLFVQAQTEQEMCEKLLVALLSCHATPELAHDELRYETDFGGSETAHLRVECIAKKCGKQKTIIDQTVPTWQVGAMTLAFHTAHEGHPMRITINGDTWESPDR